MGCWHIYTVYAYITVICEFHGNNNLWPGLSVVLQKLLEPHRSIIFGWLIAKGHVSREPNKLHDKVNLQKEMW